MIAANRGIDPISDALTTAPEDLSGLSKNVPSYGLQHESKDTGYAYNQEVEDDVPRPTEEERTTLRRVSGSIPWVAYSLCAVEFAERASYYGCSFVFSNFVQFPLP